MGALWMVGIVAVAAGVVIGWFAASGRASAADARAEELRTQLLGARQEVETKNRAAVEALATRAAAEARANEVERKFAEQQTRLTDTFKALATDVLSASKQDFLQLAEQKFSALQQNATSDLEARRTAVEQLVKPLGEALQNYQRETQSLESRRQKDLGSVGAQLAAVAETQGILHQETAKLVNALRSPQVRGRWGEIALRRTAELAGMSAHCDFTEQQTVITDDGRIRPDMVVHLPAGREVVVDSKVPLDGFLKSLEAKTDPERLAALDLHAAQMRHHVNGLASKQYWEQFETAPEFVVLFIVNDSFLAAAAERDSGLIEDALAKHVVIATPTTLIALLRAIAYGWRQEQIQQSAQEVNELGRKLYERIVTFLEHLEGVGSGLKKAVEAYNKSVASLETRLLPHAEKFEALGVSTQKPLPDVEQIAEQPRVVAQRSLPGVGDDDEERKEEAKSVAVKVK